MPGPVRRRAGPRKSRPNVINGVEIPYDPDLDVDTDKPLPAPLYPDYQLEPPKPLTEAEERQVNHFLSIKEAIRNGPHYSVLDEDLKVHKSRTKAVNDPFHGASRYSQRYLKEPRTAPKLDPGAYDLKLFPRELWSVIDPKYLPKRASKRKRGEEGSTGAKVNKDEIKHAGGAAQVGQDIGQDGETLHPGTSKLDGVEDEEDEDKVSDLEELDDEFDDDEDGGDYNAEQYFDDGGDDAGDDYDAGGDGSGYFE